MQVDNNLYSNEPTAMSIQLEIEQKKWQPKPQPNQPIKCARTFYNQDVCSTVYEVYQHNLLNPNT
jgi:hypothetical protein